MSLAVQASRHLQLCLACNVWQSVPSLAFCIGHSPPDCSIGGCPEWVLIFDLEMRPLLYSINLTLDGCCDHRTGTNDPELHRYWAQSLIDSDALLFGRVTYEMMKSAWNWPNGVRPEWAAEWMEPFSKAISEAKKFVVSKTLTCEADWNTEVISEDLEAAVRKLKSEVGKRIFVSGVTLPAALSKLGLIDEYEFVVHPKIAGHGPRLLDGILSHIELQLVSRKEFSSGAVALAYKTVPKKQF